MGGYTKAVSGQWLGKHVPAATDTNITVAQQQRNGVFCVIRASAVATQWRGKHIFAATNLDTTIEVVFSV
jgi:hypothetical protein